VRSLAPLPPPEDRTLRAVGARRRAPGAPKVGEIVQALRTLARDSDALVSVFDATAIAGERHLYSAWAHLGRSRGRGEARLRDRGAELALFVAGDDQLPRALAKVGVSDRTEEFVLVAEKPREPEELLATFGLVADAAVYPRPPSAATLARLGIDDAERASVPESAWEGLVLERVALVELTAPAGRAAPTKH
jgi:tRNA threonylcarbamoyladenosine modification (KEOPS) complex Cgi121 subunit